MDKKNPHAVALGKMGGRKGGLARAANMSKEQLSQAAQHAARSRWDRPRNVTEAPDGTPEVTE